MKKVYSKYTYDELLTEVNWLSNQNSKLQTDNDELRKQAQEGVELAVQCALASDRMKFDLIVNGCLNRPIQNEKSQTEI